MKIKLLALGNRNGYNYFIFKKEQKLLQLFRKILLDFNEIESVVDDMIYEGGLCYIEEAKEKNKKLKEKKINSMVDNRYNFSGKDFNIDIIFGNKKVFFIAYMDLKKRNKIMEHIQKDYKFEK